MGLMALAARPNSASANDYESQRIQSSMAARSNTSDSVGPDIEGAGSVCTRSSDEGKSVTVMCL